MEKKYEHLLSAWTQGVTDFNAGKYWHAHECWEWGWKSLPKDPPDGSGERQYVQALIQVCGMFHLFLMKSRPRPAFALARSALARLQKTDEKLELVFPRLEIEDVRKILKEIIPLEQTGFTQDDIQAFAKSMRARVLIKE